MKFAARDLSIAVFLLAASFPAATANAQTVQLPTFHFFTLNTSVLVPDGGDAFLGGVNRATSGRNERGIPGLPGRPFTNTGIGGSTVASGVSVALRFTTWTRWIERFWVTISGQIQRRPNQTWQARVNWPPCKPALTRSAASPRCEHKSRPKMRLQSAKRRNRSPAESSFDRRKDEPGENLSANRRAAFEGRRSRSGFGTVRI